MTLAITRLLLIEDDEEDVLLLKKSLIRIPGFRYELIWAKSYEDGLHQMLRGEHDLCLLDYRLGAQDGIQMIVEARQQGYAHPIVLLTGMSEGEIDIQALQAGADDYIDKGRLQSDLLARVIRYAIERKKAEVERERLIGEQLAVRELEKRRNEFISMVVHELKTPLTSVKGYTQLLQKRFEREGNAANVQLATRMDVQLAKLTDLINDFLDVTRISGGTLQFRDESVDFDELVDEVVSDLQPILDPHVVERHGHTQAHVWGDPMRIGQVLTNLLTNAAKYAPQAKQILVKTTADAETVTTAVQDFGPGIAKDLQQKIFDPFYRISNSEQDIVPGLGLGLHIAHEIIQRENGKLWVESEDGKGSTFYFTLPVKPVDVDLNTQKPATDEVAAQESSAS